MPEPAARFVARLALGAFEAQVAGHAEFTLLTQNIDGLHQRAGSRNVVELHRGRIEAENDPQGGAVISVYLPRARAT